MLTIMELNNSDLKVLQAAIKKWEEEGIVSPEKATELRQTLILKKTGQQLARYFFLFALFCILMSFGAIFIDEKLLEHLKLYFALNNYTIAIGMATLSAFWFYFISRRRKEVRDAAYEIYLTLGGLAALTALVYFCKQVGFGPSYSGFLCFATILLGSLSAAFRSRVLWVGAIFAAMGCYGGFAYAHSSHERFLGMNYPVRFVAFGLLVLGCSWIQQYVYRLRDLQRITYVCGLLIFFTALWGVSIFGNFSDMDAWMAVRQTHVIVYGVIFGLVALFALYLGIRFRDDLTRDVGLLFLLLNFYSRYAEYFWNTLHKGIFFFLLGISFWLLGKGLGRRRRKAKTKN